MSNKPNLLTALQVANHFGVSSETVYNWVDSDKMPEGAYLGRIIKMRAFDGNVINQIDSKWRPKRKV